MTQQTNAENWKIVFIGISRKTKILEVTEKSWGRFTAAAAAAKLKVKYPDYHYRKEKRYWVRAGGSIIRLVLVNQ